MSKRRSKGREIPVDAEPTGTIETLCREMCERLIPRDWKLSGNNLYLWTDNKKYAIRVSDQLARSLMRELLAK